MVDFLLAAVFLIVMISVLVLAHEAGHYAVARLFRMRVEDFSLFFGPIVARLGRRGATAFHIRAIPFGGFVRIAGMEPEEVTAGIPVLRAIKTSAHDRTALLSTLRRLSRDTMTGMDPQKIGDEVLQGVTGAIASDGVLTPEGRVAVSALRARATMNADESKLVELVLGANERAQDPELFSNKPRLQRAAVIFAGPLASLAFGCLVFCLIGVTAGLPTADSKTTNQIEQVISGGEAHRVGLRSGDRIVAIDRVPIRTGKQMVDKIHQSKGVRILLTVERDGRTFDAWVTPRPMALTDENGKKVTWGVIGITPNYEFRRVGAAESVRVGALTTYATVAALVRLFADHEQARESVGGPIAIGQRAGQVRRLGLGPMMLLAAQFSLSLGVLNLLPVPVLDGGHLVLIGLEGLRRRKLTPREVYRAHAVGLSLIAMLVIFVTYNDITRLLGVGGR